MQRKELLPKRFVALHASLILLALVAGGFGLWLSDVKRDAVREERAKVEARVQTQGRAADQNMMERKAERQAEAAADGADKDAWGQRVGMRSTMCACGSRIRG